MIDLNETHLILISCDLPHCLSTLEHINIVVELDIAKDLRTSSVYLWNLFPSKIKHDVIFVRISNDKLEILPSNYK